MKKILLSVVSTLAVAFVSCDPEDAFEDVTARRGLSFKNESKNVIEVLHISANEYVTSKDSTFFTLKQGEEKSFLEQTDYDISKLLNLRMNKDFDTLKVFCDGKLLKLWHGPLNNTTQSEHSPYDSQDWKEVQQKDTVTLQFTFTDKDFE